MIPAPFEYEVAESVDHAVELLGRSDAKPLAGGHSLIPLLRLRVARPALLVDIGRIGELRSVRDGGDRIAIGALTRHHDLASDPVLQEHVPLLPHVAGLIGDPQVRRRGTIGGSVAHCDPASDLPTVLLALDAEIVVRGAEAERAVPAAEFFRGVFETACGPQELVTEIRVPKDAGGDGWAYEKFRRRAQDWATVGVAAIVRRNGGSEASIALTNMGPTALRAGAAEAAFRDGGIEAAAERAADDASPTSDVSASADFRRHLARVLTRRALEEAMAR